MTRAGLSNRAAADSPPRPGLVAIVIVGFNNRDLVVACLASIRSVPYRPLQVFYVDNASADGTLVAVHRDFPEVTALDSGGNLGYCGGNNVGIRLALAAGAEYVLLLNPDTTVHDPAFIGTLVDYLRGHPHVGKVGPRVFLRQPGQVQNTVLSWPSIRCNPFRMVRSAKPAADRGTPTRVDVLNGCCVMVRADALYEVGLYDEEYFAYVDEAEWDWRAERAGWERHFVPIDSIVHHQKQTGYEFTSFTHFLMKRNTALWFLNAGKPVALLIWMTGTAAMALGRAVAAPFRGQSAVSYARFLAKLVMAYGRIFGRLLTGRRRSPESLQAFAR